VTSQLGAKSTSLQCRASGDPLPEVTFHKDSWRDPFVPGPQPDSRLFLDVAKEGRFTSATLKISDVARIDDGLYKCIAYNKRTRCKYKFCACAGEEVDLL
jgi:hypothetical protein